MSMTVPYYKTFMASVGFSDADYICDGMNDSNKIQQAIDYVNSLGGGTVYIKTGNYSINQKINLKNNIFIKGSGGKSTQLSLMNNINQSIFSSEISPISNIIIEDLFCVGNSKNNTGNSHGIMAINCSDCSFERNIFTDFVLDGVYLSGSIGNRIIGNISYQNNRNGIGAGSFSNSINENNFILNNKCYLNGNTGIDIEPMNKTILIGNTSYQNIKDGIAFDGDFSISSNNRCYLNGTYGIHAIGNYLIINENLIFNNSQTDIGFRGGIRLSDSKYCSVSNNVCFDDQIIKTQRYGIEEFGTSENNVVSGTVGSGNIIGLIGNTAIT